MADKDNDPVALWQNMLGQMEKGFSAFANQAMASPELSKVVGQVGEASADAQKRLGELMEKYLASMNLPSKEQMASFGERLTAIETRLDAITAALRQSGPAAADHAPPPGPKASRGKRPPSVDDESK